MQPKRTILIITTTFFPDTNVGAVRMTQWCRHLPEFGWRPVVLTRYHGDDVGIAEIARQIHADVSVFSFERARNYLTRSCAFENPETIPHREHQPADASPVTVGKLPLKIRIARSLTPILVPDASVGFWRRRARKTTLGMVDRIRPDIVLTTSPMHSVHDVGMWIKRERPNIQWVADFRDPLLIDNRYGPFGLRRLSAGRLRRYAASIYDIADLIVNAIDFEARWIRIQFPSARSKVRTLANGFPADMLTGLEPMVASSERRSICVMGATNPAQRLQLTRATAELIAEGHDIELCLLGRGPDDADQLREVLNGRIKVTGQLVHRDALRHLLSADVLVCPLALDRSATEGLSSKLFEFFACGKPIIVINPTRPDRLLVRSLEGVRVLREPNAEELRLAFRWALSEEAQPPAEQAARMRETYSRRTQTGQLAAWLDELTDRRGKMASSLVE